MRSTHTKVRFLAAVATFDTYKDDTGNIVKYLLKIDYFPTLKDGTLDTKPQSLLEIFDETLRSSDEPDRFVGIVTAIVGSGLDMDTDGEKIQSFLDALSPQHKIPIVAPTPTDGYATFADELAAFKQLDADAKATATRDGTMGPGKVAKFAIDTAVRILAEREAKRDEKRAAAQTEELKQQEQQHQHQHQHHQQQSSPSATGTYAVSAINSNQKRYSCRKCRTVLFGEDDLENPPHVPAQHNFGYRKKGGGSGGGTCQSLFLQAVPPWVTTDLSLNEGKITCYKCDTKVGHFHWAGAQCSCGTWVCPAIQVPHSRVDEVLPQTADHSLPTGTIISPVIPTTLLQS
jgi:dual specificity phosphatase 12